ncbi:MAG: hypothetical protein WBO58_01905 [Gammaproteobacteria bacterium]
MDIIDNVAMPARNCYPCTACCDGWLSSNYIEMSPGKPCAHRTDEGCAIHKNRPQVCKKFECDWLKADSQLPDDMRPDICGAIVMTGRRFQNWRIILATPTGWTIPQQTLERLMAYAKTQSIPLVYIENLHENGVYTHFKRSGYGPLDFIRSIQNATEPFNLRDTDE